MALLTYGAVLGLALAAVGVPGVQRRRRRRARHALHFVRLSAPEKR